VAADRGVALALFLLLTFSLDVLAVRSLIRLNILEAGAAAQKWIDEGKPAI
jgi:hypothetical protein